MGTAEGGPKHGKPGLPGVLARKGARTVRLNVLVDPETKTILVVRTKTDYDPIHGRVEKITTSCDVTNQALNVIAHYMSISGLSELTTESGVLKFEPNAKEEPSQ